MTPDPKWLDILKASGPQLAGLAMALAALLYGDRAGLLPVSLDETVRQGVVVAAAVLGGLAFASVLSWIGRVASAAGKHLTQWWSRRKFIAAAEKHIAFLTPIDRQILGYMLANNQKTILADVDGGNAVALISSGFLIRHMQPGQAVIPSDVPFTVPDEVWNVLLRNRDKFPAPPNSEGAHPWRVNWMAGR